MEPYDEENIDDDDLVIRRINPEHHVVWDDDRSCNRVSSKAFSPSSNGDGGMSVDIEQLMIGAGIDPRQYVTTPEFTGSVSFPARTARELNLVVGYEPLENNPYHGEVWNPLRPQYFTGGQKRKLQEGSIWYVEIPDVEII